MSKINEYPQAVTINNNDLFVIDQESGGEHATKSASVSQIADKATSGVQTQIGDLSQLTTTDKSSLVGAVNEVHSQTATTDGTSTTVTFDFHEAFAGGGNGVLLISYRVAGTTDDGIVLIKLYGTTNMVVSTKVGTNASKFTGVSYDSGTKKITATVGNYATVTFIQ